LRRRKATRPATDYLVNEPRAIDPADRREATPRHRPVQAWRAFPEVRDRRQKTPTIMHDAFVAALFAWAARGNRNGKVILPGGSVDSAELLRVLVALKCAGTVRVFPDTQNRRRASRQ
jgi:hypothetical protein